MRKNKDVWKITLDAIPYHEPIVMVTIAGIILGGLAVAGLITYFGKWQYLWKEWLTSVDHKRLGIMYLILAWSCCCAASPMR
ncbi:hypothetical protein ACLK19_02965 [Escherichia coli]